MYRIYDTFNWAEKCGRIQVVCMAQVFITSYGRIRVFEYHLCSKRFVDAVFKIEHNITSL
jgi:hypothetical protein